MSTPSATSDAAVQPSPTSLFLPPKSEKTARRRRRRGQRPVVIKNEPPEVIITPSKENGVMNVFDVEKDTVYGDNAQVNGVMNVYDLGENTVYADKASVGIPRSEAEETIYVAPVNWVDTKKEEPIDIHSTNVGSPMARTSSSLIRIIEQKQTGFVPFISRQAYPIQLAFLIILMSVGISLGVLLSKMSPKVTPRQLMFFTFPGELMIRMLKMISLPLLITNVVTSIFSLDLKSNGIISLRLLVYVMTTTFAAVIIGSITAAAMIDWNIDTNKQDLIKGEAVDAIFLPADNVLDLFRSMFPDNLLKASHSQDETVYKIIDQCENANTTICTVQVDTVTYPFIEENSTTHFTYSLSDSGQPNLFGLTILSIAVGLIICNMGHETHTIKELFSCMASVCLRISKLITWLTPFVSGSLLVGQFSRSDNFSSAVRSGLTRYLLAVLVGLLVHALIVLPLFFVGITKRKPFKFYGGLVQALLIGFATNSSIVTLPVTMLALEYNNGVDRRITGQVLPLGSLINVNGSAIKHVVAAMFIASINNIPIGAEVYFGIIFTALLGSIVTAGFPRDRLTVTLLVLSAAGLPLQDLTYLLAIDWFVHRFCTMVDILGDAVGCGIIHHLSGKQLERHKFSCIHTRLN